MTFVSVGNVLVDILTRVPSLPVRGGDMLGTPSGMAAGGAFNAMVAASRQGLAAAYAGGHGTGYFGDLIRRELSDNRIDVLLPPTPDRDSGYDLALVDRDGERTFVTCFGAEAALTADALNSVDLAATDILHVSGYGLLDTTNAEVLAAWLRTVDPHVTVIVDPGPLVRDIRPAVWAEVARRADWISCNESEAEALRLDDSSQVIVRLGASGCEVHRGSSSVAVPGFAVEAVDTNGAGDAHVGAFAAALAAGLAPEDAALRANACAAIAVSRFGPASAPTLGEVIALIDRRT